MASKTIIMAAAAATMATAIVPATAMAQDRYHSGYDGYSQQDEQEGWSRDRGDERRNWHDRQGYDRQAYDRSGDRYADRGYQADYRYDDNQIRYDQSGYDRRNYGRPTYRYRCQGSGATGTIVGALAGGLIGHGLAGHGDRTLGVLLGGGAGALAGRAIDKSNSRC